MDVGSVGLDQKSFQTATQVVMEDIEFSDKVIEEALRKLLDDQELPVGYMLAAILASISRENVRNFIYREVIPALVNRNAWDTATQVWRGLKFLLKNIRAGQDCYFS